MNNFNSFSRQCALALVSYLQRYDFHIVMSFSRTGYCEVTVFFECEGDMHRIRKSLGSLVDNAFLVQEYSPECSYGNTPYLSVLFQDEK